jgi:hypothetical protein
MCAVATECLKAGALGTGLPGMNERTFLYIFWWAGCVGHSFAYVANFVYLRDVWIRTQRGAVASMQDRCATNLATQFTFLKPIAHKTA